MEQKIKENSQRIADIDRWFEVNKKIEDLQNKTNNMVFLISNIGKA